MIKCFRVIAYTPYSGEEFTGYCCYHEDVPAEVERARDFANVLIAENADDYIYNHIDNFEDEEAVENYYKGCGAIWQEIDERTFMEEAFEDYELEGDWV